VSRIPLLNGDEAPLLSRAWYGADRSASPLTRSLATAPDLLDTLMPFLGQVMAAGALDLATKELAIVRVSHLNGCRYCLAAHRPLAADAGVPREQLDAICGSGSLDVLSARERALVEWVDALTLDARRIDDRLVARMLDHYRDDELVELTVLAGTITMLNQYCTAFDLPPPAMP